MQFTGFSDAIGVGKRNKPQVHGSLGASIILDLHPNKPGISLKKPGGEKASFEINQKNDHDTDA
jgi:hypothetical protein